MMSARFARAGLRATQFSAPRTAAVNGLRSYATAPEARAPVALFGVDGTYATALVCTSIASLLHATVSTFRNSHLFPTPQGSPLSIQNIFNFQPSIFNLHQTAPPKTEHPSNHSSNSTLPPPSLPPSTRPPVPSPASARPSRPTRSCPPSSAPPP